jgi:hypothetical protein
MKARLTIAVLIASFYAQNVSACGAIAFNPNTQAWGRATGYADLADAMNHAISDCKDGCGIYAWTSNEVVTAIVFQGSKWATSTGNTAALAVAHAKAFCPSCTGDVTAGSN